MEIQRHYIDASGNHFVATFSDAPKAEAYSPPSGATEIAQPPTEAHRWLEGEWMLPPAPPAPTPSDVNLTDRQLRIGLLSAGYDLAVVEGAIEGIPDPIDRAIARVWWDRTLVIYWDHPMTQTLMGLAGIPENERVLLWMWASDIPA